MKKNTPATPIRGSVGLRHEADGGSVDFTEQQARVLPVERAVAVHIFLPADYISDDGLERDRVRFAQSRPQAKAGAQS